MHALLLSVISAAAAAGEGVETMQPEQAAVTREHVELVLVPGSAQLNGVDTQHFGAGAELIWHVHERFGFKVFGHYNYVARSSSFGTELIDSARYQARALQAMLITAAVHGGLEGVPFDVAARFYERPVHFSLLFDAGLGAAATQHELKPQNELPASYGDTGWTFSAAIGAAVRVRLGDHFSLRLGVRDYIYSTAVSTVNGCNRTDLAELDARQRANRRDVQPVTAGCRVDSFEGADANGRKNADDVPLAYAIAKAPAAGLAHNVTAYLGASVSF